MTTRKRLMVGAIVAASVSLLIIIGAWLAGFDFDKRGHVAFTVFGLCVFIGGGVGAMTFDLLRKD